MLETIFGGDVFRVMMIFVRVGAVIMLLPGIGETYVTATARLAFALFTAVLISPVILPVLPLPAPQSPSDVVAFIGSEFLIGLFIGTLTRTLLAAMAVCGTVIAFTTGFSNAFMFNPTLSDQGVVQAVFFTLLGVLVVFVTNTHHLFLRAMVESYQVFAPGSLFQANTNVGSMADVITQTTAQSFTLGVQMATPFIVVFVVMYVLLAILARLMPQFQVFFVMMPLQILLGIAMTVLVIGTIMIVFGRSMQELARSLSVG